MHALAEKLNQQIQHLAPAVYNSLSEFGKELFTPQGILTQALEANQKAYKFNATAGMAIHKADYLHLPASASYFKGLSAAEIFAYAPTAGKTELRKLWQQKIQRQNPDLKNRPFSLPLVTAGITHGLWLASEMFIDAKDPILIPDQMWGNYRQIFGLRRKAQESNFPFFNQQRTFNTLGFEKTLLSLAKEHEKIGVMFNFPNNPTGYMPTEVEVNQLVNSINNFAERDKRIIVFCDDAYVGLVYKAGYRQSIFAKLCGLHPNIIAIKLDGITKEQYAWGLRVGFFSLGVKCEDSEAVYSAIENKAQGALRTNVSNCSQIAQSVTIKLLKSAEYTEQIETNYKIMEQKGMQFSQLMHQADYEQFWQAYPFNSGYFMCLKLQTVEAETLRVHMLERHGIGTISSGRFDLRIAFSSLDIESMPEFCQRLAQGCQELNG